MKGKQVGGSILLFLVILLLMQAPVYAGPNSPVQTISSSAMQTAVSAETGLPGNVYLKEALLPSIFLQKAGTTVKYKTGVYKVKGKWKYYKNGKFKKKTGLAKRKADGKWVYVQKGVFKKFTGVVSRISDGKLFFVRKGILDKTFSGISADLSGTKYIVKKGIASRYLPSNSKTAAETETGSAAEPVTEPETEPETEPQTQPSTDPDTEEAEITNPETPSEGNIPIGTQISFGSYEQDNKTTNGKETIIWTVLASTEDKALLISNYGLDCLTYNSSYAPVTWETCSLRNWMNNDFYQSAFTDDEKAKILSVRLSTPENSLYHCSGGNDTVDKVFLLSLNEAAAYFDTDDDRILKPTAYALTKNPYTNYTTKNCWWWLRTPGDVQYIASGISDDGTLNYLGYCVDATVVCVRPAVWVDLEESDS